MNRDDVSAFFPARRWSGTRTMAAVGAVLLGNLAALQPVSAADKSPLIEEIVVTTRFRQEAAQESPTALTAFNPVILQNITAQDLRDVGPLSPNTHIQPSNFAPNSAMIHIRGMGANTIESTNEMRNGVSVNGVFISRPVATLVDFFDVATVEVLRGPQGTTFGKNSLSGGLVVNTIRPDGTFDVNSEVTVGNYDRFDFRGAVQFPIVDGKLAGRVSVLMQNYDGHFKNRVYGSDLNGEDVDSVRGTLVWTPTENLEATLIATWMRERSDANGGDDASDPNQLINIWFAGPPFYWTGEPNDGAFTVGRDGLDFWDVDQDGLTGIINWDIGSFTLTSVTGWMSTDDLVAADFDQTELPFFPTFREQEHDQWSQELRLHSDFGDREGLLGNLDLVLGLFYFWQEHEIVQSFPTLGNPSSADYAHQDGDSSAIFGQAIYAVTDNLNLTLGLRYTDESKDFERNPGELFGTRINYLDPSSRIPIDEMAALPKSVTGKLSSSRTTTKIGADYHFNENLMAFANYAQGFKAGEFGARASSSLTAGPTDDETSDSFEVGVKSDLLDGRLRLNATVFHTLYDALAFEVIVPSPNNPTGQETASQNIGEVTAQGLEIEAIAVPIDGLTLQASLGLLDAEYDEFCADLDGPLPPGVEVNPVSNCGGKVVPLPNGSYLVDIDHTDLELMRAPDTQVYLSAMYEWDTRIGGFFARASGSFESEYYSEDTNHPKGKTGDFWLWDASVGWTSTGGKWRIQGWCKNCSDKEYTFGLIPTANFFNQHFWGPPRTYGVTFGYRM